MIVAFREFLDDVSTCFLNGDLDLWRSRIELPFSIVTRHGPVVLATEERVAQNFDLYLNACKAMSLDMIDRSIVSLDDCHDGTWLGTFQTRLLSRNRIATAPYTSTALLHLDVGRFRMSSMLNGRGHEDWTGISQGWAD